MRVIARFWIWFFFERVEVRHPSVGPMRLCINHPNNLIDSLLVAYRHSTGRTTARVPSRAGSCQRATGVAVGRVIESSLRQFR